MSRTILDTVTAANLLASVETDQPDLFIRETHLDRIKLTLSGSASLFQYILMA
jgi:hypothetical protein